MKLLRLSIHVHLHEQSYQSYDFASWTCPNPNPVERHIHRYMYLHICSRSHVLCTTIHFGRTCMYRSALWVALGSWNCLWKSSLTFSDGNSSICIAHDNVTAFQSGNIIRSNVQVVQSNIMLTIFWPLTSSVMAMRWIIELPPDPTPRRLDRFWPTVNRGVKLPKPYWLYRSFFVWSSVSLKGTFLFFLFPPSRSGVPFFSQRTVFLLYL